LQQRKTLKYCPGLVDHYISADEAIKQEILK